MREDDRADAGVTEYSATLGEGSGHAGFIVRNILLRRTQTVGSVNHYLRVLRSERGAKESRLVVRECTPEPNIEEV